MTMFEYSGSSEAQDIAEHNRKFELYLTLGASPVTSPMQALALWHKGRAYTKFATLVQPDGPWDLKLNVPRVGDRRCNTTGVCLDYITMGSNTSAQCYRFDVPGNILFGYVGRSAGFRSMELLGAASWAQFFDNLIKKEGWQRFEFDEPEDQAAVLAGWNAVDIGLNTSLKIFNEDLRTSSECSPCQVRWTGKF